MSARLVDHVDCELSTLLGRIRDVGLIIVALGYKREDVPHPLDGSGFVVSRTDGASVSAVTWMSSKWMGRAPANRVLLRAPIRRAPEPNASESSDADLIGCVRADLRRYLRVSGAPLFARVYRMPHAAVQLGTLPR